MIKISEASSLALHSMALLAQDPERMLTTKQISQRLDASEAHLSKVLQRLHKSGLVKSVRGPKGGFMLEKDPAQTTLKEVYEVIEGSLVLKNCLLSEAACKGDKCVLGGLLQTINKEVRDYLANTKLSELSGVY